MQRTPRELFLAGAPSRSHHPHGRACEQRLAVSACAKQRVSSRLSEPRSAPDAGRREDGQVMARSSGAFLHPAAGHARVLYPGMHSLLPATSACRAFDFLDIGVQRPVGA